MGTKTGFILMNEASNYLMGNFSFTSSIDNAQLWEPYRASFLLDKMPELIKLPAKQVCKIQVTK